DYNNPLESHSEEEMEMQPTPKTGVDGSDPENSKSHLPPRQLDFEKQQKMATEEEHVKSEGEESPNPYADDCDYVDMFSQALEESLQSGSPTAAQAMFNEALDFQVKKALKEAQEAAGKTAEEEESKDSKSKTNKAAVSASGKSKTDGKPTQTTLLGFVSGLKKKATTTPAAETGEDASKSTSKKTRSKDAGAKNDDDGPVDENTVMPEFEMGELV
ncbi:unnamed protein product, partial [Amoebophrya sp. A25]